MIRAYVTIFAGLLGLAFGSFLNVCVSRWPEYESVTHPRSHCRNCEHPLAWWENVPLLSWIILRGRCHHCRAWISIRYPLVELTIGALWAFTVWRSAAELFEQNLPLMSIAPDLVATAGIMTFYWMLVALAALDAENLWLPNKITIPGIALGFLFGMMKAVLVALSPVHGPVNKFELIWFEVRPVLMWTTISVIVTAGLLLLIRWLYGVFRHREGMGLGDVKLIAMLAAWLGLPATLLAFFVSAMIGGIAAVIVIVSPHAREEEQDWATTKLPFGTFLCVGGIIASLWGQPIIAAYLQMIGIN
jgi:leader peptidase (prepilin peptidase) / N-methyltransferase